MFSRERLLGDDVPSHRRFGATLAGFHARTEVIDLLRTHYRQRIPRQPCRRAGSLFRGKTAGVCSIRVAPRRPIRFASLTA